MTENERLRYLRKEVLNLTLDKFGSKLGVSKSALSDVENGRNGLSNQMIMLINKTFGVSIEWLRSGDGEIFAKISNEEMIAEIVDKLYGKKSIEERLYIIDKIINASDEFIQDLYTLVKHQGNK